MVLYTEEWRGNENVTEQGALLQQAPLAAALLYYDGEAVNKPQLYSGKGIFMFARLLQLVFKSAMFK